MQILLHAKMLTNVEFYYCVYLGSFCQLYEHDQFLSGSQYFSIDLICKLLLHE